MVCENLAETGSGKPEKDREIRSVLVENCGETASNPARLDQFADDLFDRNKDETEGVTSRKEKQKWLKRD